MLGTPTKSYKNTDGRTIFCWKKEDTLVVSLDRIDKDGTGKYKEVPLAEANSFLNKLGIHETFVDVARVAPLTPVTQTSSNGFFNEDIDLRALKEERNSSINRRVQGKSAKPNEALDSPTFMNELAVIAGASGKMKVTPPTIQESQTITQVAPQAVQTPELESFFNSNVKIEKKGLSSEGVEQVQSTNQL